MSDKKKKPNLEVMRDFATKLELKVRSNATDKTIYKALRSKIDERMEGKSEEELYACDECGERTDDGKLFDEMCPFCGTGVEGSSDEVEVSKPEGVDLSDADDDIGDDDSDPDEPIETSEVENPEDDDTFEEPDSVEITEDGTELVEVGKDDLKKELDECVKGIRNAQRNTAKSVYDMGLHLNKVRDRDLWKVDGHKTFKDFCESLELSKPFAYHLIRFTQEYDRETFAKVGIRKLMVISSVKDEKERNELLEDAKGGASVRDLQDKTKPKKEDKKKDKTEPESDRSEREEPEPENDSIVLLAKVGARPTVYPFQSAKTNKELKMWEKDSFLRIQISEDVQQLIALRCNDKGEIVGAAVAFTHKDADADE